MVDPKSLSISDFSYPLPEERIAAFPLKERDRSKLLHYNEGVISDHTFFDLPDLLRSGDLLVYNNTRVIHARIIFQKETGARIEVFCLEPDKNNYQEAFTANSTSVWKCLIGNAKRWKNETLEKEWRIGEKNVVLYARKTNETNLFHEVEFTWSDPSVSFGELLFHAGVLPLPPYLNREAEESDEVSYQTVFAQHEGSVAAPTAGLHFTEQVMENLSKKGILSTGLTLHVGAGTFLPVKSETMADHEMHQESIFVNLETLTSLHQNLKLGKRIIAVGTTSLRTIESIYWYGVHLIKGTERKGHLLVDQWDPYEVDQTVPPHEAYEAVIRQMKSQDEAELSGSTRLLIAPGYPVKVANGLITNFHQPNSTLLLLVSAFIGEDWKGLYQHALDNDYRFLSFGDSSLLWRD